MMVLTTQQIANDLRQAPLAFCQRYLPNGRKQGNKWRCGDVYGNAGQSMTVQLQGVKQGLFYDYSNQQHGDLLEILKQQFGTDTFVSEAKAFLGVSNDKTYTPKPLHPPKTVDKAEQQRQANIQQQVTDILNNCVSIIGTMGEQYLQARGITYTDGLDTVLFNPSVPYWHNGTQSPMPALIGKICDMAVHRIYLNKDSLYMGKAFDKRLLGGVKGTGVVFMPNTPIHTVIVAEGIETALSLRQHYPQHMVVAGLSTSGMSNYDLPAYIHKDTVRVAIAIDNDTNSAGLDAGLCLADKLAEQGVQSAIFTPVLGDFNDDLIQLGQAKLSHKVHIDERNNTMSEQQNTFQGAAIQVLKYQTNALNHGYVAKVVESIEKIKYHGESLKSPDNETRWKHEAIMYKKSCQEIALASNTNLQPESYALMADTFTSHGLQALVKNTQAQTPEVLDKLVERGLQSVQAEILKIENLDGAILDKLVQSKHEKIQTIAKDYQADGTPPKQQAPKKQPAQSNVKGNAKSTTKKNTAKKTANKGR